MYGKENNLDLLGEEKTGMATKIHFEPRDEPRMMGAEKVRGSGVACGRLVMLEFWAVEAVRAPKDKTAAGQSEKEKEEKENRENSTMHSDVERSSIPRGNNGKALSQHAIYAVRILGL